MIAEGWKNAHLVGQYFDHYHDPLTGERIAKLFRDRYKYLKAQLINPGDIMASLYELVTGIGGWGSYTKDSLENRLHGMVCRGQISLKQAQHDIATDWIAAYKQYVGTAPDQDRSHRYGG